MQKILQYVFGGKLYIDDTRTYVLVQLPFDHELYDYVGNQISDKGNRHYHLMSNDEEIFAQNRFRYKWNDIGVKCIKRLETDKIV